MTFVFTAVRVTLDRERIILSYYISNGLQSLSYGCIMADVVGSQQCLQLTTRLVCHSLLFTLVVNQLAFEKESYAFKGAKDAGHRDSVLHHDDRARRPGTVGYLSSFLFLIPVHQL